MKLIKVCRKNIRNFPYKYVRFENGYEKMRISNFESQSLKSTWRAKMMAKKMMTKLNNPVIKPMV